MSKWSQAKKAPYDFSGYVTKNDTLCTDGVVIRHGAFAENDGKEVPLVWGHDHRDMNNIIGHILLQNDDVGVIGYGTFNDTEMGQRAKTLVQHRDIYSMSIGANRIKRTPQNDVVGGNIYEVSLVVAGANPGAVITEVLTHSDNEGETIIMESKELIHSEYSGEEKISFLDRIQHAEDSESVGKAIDEVMDTLNEEQQQAVAVLLDATAETASNAAVEALEEDFDAAVEAEVDAILEELASEEDDSDESDDNIEQSGLGGNTLMHYNVFENNSLQHAAMVEEQNTELRDELTHALQIAQERQVSLSSVLSELDRENGSNVLQHSINSVEKLFPEHSLTKGVQVVYSTNTATEHILSAVTKVPTAFVKSILADLTDLTNEQLRAKGYIKGSEKKEQIIGFLTRKTDPKTIYKKQSIDRDDAIDIGQSLNVAAFFHQEMRIKLNDEIAQSIMVGDGREAGSPDKIDETKIRPIKNDADFYTIKKAYDDKALLDVFQVVADAKIDMMGSGTPSLYVHPSLLSKLRFLRNKNDQWVFGGQQPATREYLASLFGVKEIVETKFLGEGEMIMVNLSDYQIGTNKGGEVNTFEKFDIDYNKQKYLIETRLSGALVQPKAAVFFYPNTASAPEVPEGADPK